MSRVLTAFKGNTLMARALRSASWLILNYGLNQGLRLVSNLVLTRILFPEAFGLMALVSLVTVGLALFSDIGIGPAIAHNKRGDDPDFLDTAWTLQLIRGFGLWAGTCVLALPMAQFYHEPSLALYLPIAGVASLITGLAPMKIETAHRHLLLGRLTVLELLSQLIGITAMITVGLITQSVIALVMGGIFQSTARVLLTLWFLPGPGNRLRWDRDTAQEIMSFGRWIFFSTALWFLTSQGDRLILGRFLTMQMLGLYNIGFFLASFPTMMGHSVTNRLLIPIFRDRPAHAAPENFRRQRFLRIGLLAGMGVLSLAMSLAGPALVNLMYDSRYLASGAIVTMMACALIPSALGMTYDQAALAAGDSRSFFIYSAVRAVAQVSLILAGVIWFGLFGAITAMALAQMVTYPALVWLARRHRVWDPLTDLGFWTLTLAGCAFALWLHWPLVIQVPGAPF
ncbi:oligosaccharide flippase family protein [Pseudodonghicola flavimaris]|uniref:Oligosaccharide flippase family protein n=1 Tax=Pseudodonghicola flavimaris TaxID=3050036 RepID=A0ABT7F3J5_9RHOB|nr:oligosaccharide flippase family protein [Pseudodonghicola flavimaris]MDK3019178.1 oligosaccharide flippase family protein [Pseudodonghicola flavimaris]